MKKIKRALLTALAASVLCGCRTAESGRPLYTYERNAVHSVSGRQGICTENGYYWVSGSASLAKYDADGI